MLRQLILKAGLPAVAGALLLAAPANAQYGGVRVGVGGGGVRVGVGVGGVGVGVNVGSYYRPGYVVNPAYGWSGSLYPYRPYYSGYYGWGWGVPSYYSYYTSPGYYPNYYAVPPYVPSARYYGSGISAGSGYASSAGTYQSYYPPAAPGSNAQAYTPPPPTPTNDPNAVLVNVRVPDANAQVLIDGARTTQQGTLRQFISPPLTPGRKFSYEVEARWSENGKEVSQTRKVIIQAGDTVNVDFTQPEAR